METYNAGVEEHPVRYLAAHNGNCLASAGSYHWRVGREGFLFGPSSGCFRCRNAGRYLCGREKHDEQLTSIRRMKAVSLILDF